MFGGRGKPRNMSSREIQVVLLHSLRSILSRASEVYYLMALVRSTAEGERTYEVNHSRMSLSGVAGIRVRDKEARQQMFWCFETLDSAHDIVSHMFQYFSGCSRD